MSITLRIVFCSHLQTDIHRIYRHWWSINYYTVWGKMALIWCVCMTHCSVYSFSIYPYYIHRNVQFFFHFSFQNGFWLESSFFFFLIWQYFGKFKLGWSILFYGSCFSVLENDESETVFYPWHWVYIFRYDPWLCVVRTNGQRHITISAFDGPRTDVCANFHLKRKKNSIT